ncbi:MAG: hypothetical protein QOG07_3616, partial [Pseudonocardiales bacterium]|nr:hypothetical protein [Pseudonocardiales bacterium]
MSQAKVSGRLLTGTITPVPK